MKARPSAAQHPEHHDSSESLSPSLEGFKGRFHLPELDNLAIKGLRGEKMEKLKGIIEQFASKATQLPPPPPIPALLAAPTPENVANYFKYYSGELNEEIETYTKAVDTLLKEFLQEVRAMYETIHSEQDLLRSGAPIGQTSELLWEKDRQIFESLFEQMCGEEHWLRKSTRDAVKTAIGLNILDDLSS